MVMVIIIDILDIINILEVVESHWYCMLEEESVSRANRVHRARTLAQSAESDFTLLHLQV